MITSVIGGIVGFIVALGIGYFLRVIHEHINAGRALAGGSTTVRKERASE